MAFKYINPGYAELLSVKDGATVIGEQYSKTGVSFWQPTYYKGLNLSEVPPELYGRFDMYIKDTEKVKQRNSGAHGRFAGATITRCLP